MYYNSFLRGRISSDAVTLARRYQCTNMQIVIIGFKRIAIESRYASRETRTSKEKAKCMEYGTESGTRSPTSVRANATRWPVVSLVDTI